MPHWEVKTKEWFPPTNYKCIRIHMHRFMHTCTTESECGFSIFIGIFIYKNFFHELSRSITCKYQSPKYLTLSREPQFTVWCQLAAVVFCVVVCAFFRKLKAFPEGPQSTCECIGKCNVTCRQGFYQVGQKMP